MDSIIKLLKWINDNWAAIVTVGVLIVGIYFKAKSTYIKFKNMTEEEKQQEFNKAVEKAKKAIKQIILSYISDAEINWGGGLGEIKRAEVIAKIYEAYPVLVEVTDQEELIKYIDELIDETLKIVREKLRDEE